MAVSDVDTGYSARRFEAWYDVPEDWRDARRTPFQTQTFLKAWYATLGARPGQSPLIVELRREGAPAMLLPLVREMRGGLRQIAFADANVADNNAPLLGPAAPASAEAFHAGWLAIAQVMPPADMLAIDKQPATIAGAPNPLKWLGRPQPSTLQAHPLTIAGDYEAYSRSRTKKFRKEQERVWRVFTRMPDAAFELAQSPERALTLLDGMGRLQSARMAELGADYRLDEPAYVAFYRTLVRGGIESGDVVLGALTSGDEVVAGLLGVSNGRSVAFVRLGHAGGIWANCSPGRLVIERTLIALHERGISAFDFSIGDQSYKEPFGIGSEPLSDTQVPLSWRAWPTIASTYARTQLRQIPAIRTIYERVRKASSA